MFDAKYTIRVDKNMGLALVGKFNTGAAFLR